MIFKCEYCSKEFKESPANRRLPHIFCNRTCQHKWWISQRPIRFMKKVKKLPYGCWFFTPSKHIDVYGQFCGIPAHRFSYEMKYGKIPKGLFILHLCDTPSCVNPDHLKAGTQRENVLGCSERGRISCGELRPQHKLTTSDVLEIRRLYSIHAFTQTQLANKYNVSDRNIFSIIHRQRWKHI